MGRFCVGCFVYLIGFFCFYSDSDFVFIMLGFGILYEVWIVCRLIGMLFSIQIYISTSIYIHLHPSTYR